MRVFFCLRVRRERTILLFVLFSEEFWQRDAARIVVKVFSRVWKNHLLYGLLFREIGASPLLCPCMCMWVSSVEFIWVVKDRVSEKERESMELVRGFIEKVTFSKQSMKTYIPL